MSLSNAHFKNQVVIDGELTGLTVTRIDAEKTAVLNSLNQHISNYNASESANATARADIVQSVTNLDNATTQGFTDVNATINQNKTDIEASLASEVNARLSLEGAVNTRNTFVDSEIVRLDAQHTSDDARLTQVETDLSNVDTTIQNTISAQIDDFNQHTANILPRVDDIEAKFTIDNVAKTITIPADYKLIVLGEFEQGS